MQLVDIHHQLGQFPLLVIEQLEDLVNLRYLFHAMPKQTEAHLNQDSIAHNHLLHLRHYQFYFQLKSLSSHFYEVNQLMIDLHLEPQPEHQLQT